MKVEDLKQFNFTSKLDNFNGLDNRTYPQRYWVDDQFWNNLTGPVFVYICGAYRCEPPTAKDYPYQLC